MVHILNLGLWTNNRFLSDQSICKVNSCYVKRDEFTRKYIISPLTLTLGQGQTQNVAHNPLHHMVYVPAKFEVAMSNSLGGNAFTRNIWFDHYIKHCPLHYVTYVPAKFEVARDNG